MLLAGLLLAVLPGCSTSATQLRRGEALALEERYVEAAFNFVRALEGGPQEAHLERAEAGLRSVAPFLIPATREAVASAIQRSDWERVQTAVEALYVLRSRARALGIPLYENQGEALAELSGDAARAAGLEGQRHEDAEEWPEAVLTYRHAINVFDPDSALAAELRTGKSRALIRLGEQQLIDGDYTSAFEAANEALASSPIPALRDEARRLRGEAEAVRLARELYIPTYYFAPLPFSIPDSAAATFPVTLQERFNDTLRYAFWSERPQVIFEEEPPSPYPGSGRAIGILTEDPGTVFRVVLEEGVTGGVSSNAEALALGQVLDVDIVLWGSMSDYRFEQAPVRNNPSRAILRASFDIGFTLVDVFGDEVMAGGSLAVGVEMEGSPIRSPEGGRDTAAVIPPAQGLAATQLDELQDRLVRAAIAQLKDRVKNELIDAATN